MRFVIPQNEEFYCMFQVKEPGSGTPMDLTGASGVFSLTTIGIECLEVLTGVVMTVEDAINGEISVRLTSEQTSGLVSEIGFAEDGYPLMPTYKARIDISSIEAPISVDIPKVYVSTMSCPA